MTEIYRNAKGKILKVRIVMLISLPVAALACWWGWDIFSTYGLRPADGGVLAPFGTRVAFGGFIALFGVAVAFGMWLYGTVYVIALDREPVTKLYHIRTLGFFGTHASSFAEADVRGAKYHAGDLYIPGAPFVEAPWTSVAVTGRRLPFVFDADGTWREYK
jgi:hypothetical protein